MVATLSILSLSAAMLSSLLLILGLFRPVLVLWFLDRSNRLKVIQGYGLAAIVFVGLYLAMKLFT